MQFSMRIISKNFIENEIKNVGFSADYLEIGLNKHKFLSLKVENLRAVEANILKQTALSCSCDCAVHRNCIDCKVEHSDCILSGTISQLINVSKKLRVQPFSMSRLSDDILKQIICSKNFAKSKIMGILNLTSDSFSDGGEFLEFNAAFRHAELMIEQGAGIIDIGSESTRPKSLPVEEDIQAERILPVVEFLKKNHPDILLSVDTRSSKVANLVLEAGVDIINDVSGLKYDKNMAKTLCKYNCDVVIMHSRSTPYDMDDCCNYKNLVDDVYLELKKQCDYALGEGIKPERIIIDAGFGLPKNYEQNFELMVRIEEFKSLGYRILAGVSRKSFLQECCGAKTPKDADEITALSSAYFALKGIDYIRVHNVEKSLSAIKFAQALR